MRERFKHQQQNRKITPWWVMSAISTPLFFWILWLYVFSAQKHHQDYNIHSNLSENQDTTLVHPDRQIFTNRFKTIALIAGGAFLWLNCRANGNTKHDNLRGANLSGADLSGADLSGADLSGANLSSADLSGADLSGADLSSANLSSANLSSANLRSANLHGTEAQCANLNGADLSSANLRYANISGAEIRSANLSGADLRQANLSGVNLDCTLLRHANFSQTNLRGALLFFVNLRNVLNLEPIQLKTKPVPFLCNVALPAYAQNPPLNPNRDCDRVPQLLSTRYEISLEEAQEIVEEAQQHQWYYPGKVGKALW